MEIFITGDTHGDFRRFRPDIFYEQEHMTKEDLVLVCGDFGGIWHGDPRDDGGPAIHYCICAWEPRKL